jgi:hypothetical protein
MVIAKAIRTGNCKRLNSNDISIRIIGMRGNSTSSHLNFLFCSFDDIDLHLFHWKPGTFFLFFFFFLFLKMMDIGTLHPLVQQILITIANTHIICNTIDNMFPIQSKRSLGKTQRLHVWRHPPSFACNESKSRHSIHTCTHVQWSMSFDWGHMFGQSLTKHWYNWECLRQINLQTTFLIVICDAKHNLMSSNWVIKKNLHSKVCENYFKLLICNVISWSIDHLVT